MLVSELGWPFGCDCADEEAERTRFQREESKITDIHKHAETGGHVTKESKTRPRM